MNTPLPEPLQSLLRPPLPTSESIRREMRADGWVLTLDLKERRKYYELWSFPYCKGIWAKLDLCSHRIAGVEGNLETVLQGLTILVGGKAIESEE